MWLQVLEELGLSEEDLVNGYVEPLTGHSSPPSHSSPSLTGHSSPSLTGHSSPPLYSPSSSSPLSPPDWRNVSLPEATSGRRRNVSRLRAMGGDPTCVPPDFNRGMKAIWEELWTAMPQSGKAGEKVKVLLHPP